MSYGHQIRVDDLRNQAHIGNSDYIVTNAFVQLNKATRSDIRLEQTIKHELNLSCDIHAYCVENKRNNQNRLYQSSKKDIHCSMSGELGNRAHLESKGNMANNT
eukprot:8776513-Heterocapsa_arctica.AAC.1